MEIYWNDYTFNKNFSEKSSPTEISGKGLDDGPQKEQIIDDQYKQRGDQIRLKLYQNIKIAQE